MVAEKLPGENYDQQAANEVQIPFNQCVQRDYQVCVSWAELICYDSVTMGDLLIFNVQVEIMLVSEFDSVLKLVDLYDCV